MKNFHLDILHQSKENTTKIYYKQFLIELTLIEIKELQLNSKSS